MYWAGLFYIFLIIIGSYLFFTYIYHTKKQCSPNTKNVNKGPYVYKFTEQKIPVYNKTVNVDKDVVIEKSDMEYYQKQLEKERELEIEKILQYSSNFNLLEKQIEKTKRLQPNRNTKLHVQNGNEQNRHVQNGNEQDEELIFNDAIDLNQFRLDAQNVHDSIVQNSVKNLFLKKKQKRNYDSQKLIDEIIEFARINNKNMRKIHDVLLQVNERNAIISNLNNITEMDVLSTMWNNASNNVRIQILNEILDAYIDDNFIVCPTGVVSRLINADIVENPEHAPKTIEIIRQEMLNTASKIRDEIEKNNPELTDDDLKQALIKEFSSIYKDIVPLEKIHQELDSWGL
jgi:hypothetical protein